MDAHGGLDQWRRFKTVSAHLVQGGVLWKLKGQDGVLKGHETLRESTVIVTAGRPSSLAAKTGCASRAVAETS